MYVVGSKSFRPDIQKPRLMENAARYIAPSVMTLMYQFQAATCSSMLEALVVVGRVALSYCNVESRVSRGNQFPQ